MIFLLNLVLAIGITMVASVLDVPGDGACFFHCIVAHFSRVLHKEIDAAELRKDICARLLENRDMTVNNLGVSPQQFFETTYGPNAQNRETLVNSHLSLEQRTPKTFKEYVDAMKHPNTYADNLIVAFSAHVLFDITVYTCSRSSVQKPLTGVKDVDNLVAMGFKVESVEAALRNSASLDQALDKLISDPSAAFVEPPSEDVWRAEPYVSGKPIHINLINDRNHFQLVMDLKPRLRLPDIECISDDEDSKPSSHLHHEPPSFGHTQPPSREQFYDTCTSILTSISPELPQDLHIRYQIERGVDGKFLASLFDSFMFPDFGLVRYRIIGFCFNDDETIAHTGCIEHLSHRNVKKLFFDRIWAKNSTTAVHTVVLGRCN